jgi:hypothetical protein
MGGKLGEFPVKESSLGSSFGIFEDPPEGGAASAFRILSALLGK